MITIKQIADELNVSPTTVSNVIHGNYKKVSSKNIERIDKKLKECNYIPYMPARMLAQEDSKIIGIVINIGYYREADDKNDESEHSMFRSMILQVLEREIRKDGYFMMYYVSKSVDEILMIMAQWNIDGMIIHGLKEEDCCLLAKQAKKPIVFIDSAYTSDNCFSNVGLYDSYGGYLAARYLLENGHRHICYLTRVNPMKGHTKERYKGYVQAVEEYGLHTDTDNIIFLSSNEDVRMNTYHELCMKKGKITGLLFDADYYAIEAMGYFLDQGMRIPDEMSIVGFDDNLFSKIVRPKLTTIHQNVEIKAVKAMELLQEHLQNPNMPYKRITLPVQLMIRDTVKNINDNNIYEI